MNIKINELLFNNGKAARPIPNKEVIEFVNNSVSPKYLYDNEILDKFTQTYFDWVQHSTLNELKNLEKFDKISFVHGTSQAFDFFYLKHSKRRFRCFQGDYIYHKVSWVDTFDWCFIEEAAIGGNDALIVSLPFSDSGSIHPQLEKILNICDKLKVPVFIDAAYYGISRELYFDLDRPCIETISFSMSKAFYGAERLRIGIRCNRHDTDDGVAVFNQFQCVSKIAAGVGYELCNKFDPDYNQIKFRDRQKVICSELKIEPSNCVLFGNASKNHDIYGDYNRGTEWRRVCISEQLGDCNEIEL